MISSFASRHGQSSGQSLSPVVSCYLDFGAGGAKGNIPGGGTEAPALGAGRIVFCLGTLSSIVLGNPQIAHDGTR